MAEAKMTTLAPLDRAIPEFADFLAKTAGVHSAAHAQNGV
jgi:hypothetical protein